MPSNYPVSVKVWSPTDAGFNYPEDLKEIVYARHVTTIYDEVTAVQQELGAGTGGLRTSVVDGITAFDPLTSGRSWPNLRARLVNMEQGVIDGSLRRVRTVGGSTITPSSASIVGLNVRATTGQTANLVEIRNSSNVVRTAFASDGLISGVIDGGNA
jgi:hypothetical protein